MKKNVNKKVLGTILAAICAISAGSMIATVSVSAANVPTSAVTASVQKNAKPYEIVLKGCDWNYSADSLNVKITCDFDYANKTAKFIATGVKEGKTNAILKTKNDDGTWNNLSICFTVDKNLNVTAQTSDSSKSAPEKEKKTGNPFIIILNGCDWNYSADSLNVKITCDFDYANKTAKFIATGVKEGKTNAILKTKNDDGTWNNLSICFTVDKNLNVTVQTA